MAKPKKKGKGHICPTCSQETWVIDDDTGINPLDIPMSEYHVRCRECLWPVAKSIVTSDGLCEICNTKKKEKEEHHV